MDCNLIDPFSSLLILNFMNLFELSTKMKRGSWDILGNSTRRHFKDCGIVKYLTDFFTFEFAVIVTKFIIVVFGIPPCEYKH